MKLDHTAFIARHHKMPDLVAPPLQKGWLRGWMVIFLFSLLYMGGCVAAVLWLGVDRDAAAMAILAFLAVLGLVFGVKGFRRAQHRKSSSYEIIREVMEGSRGGRLITDAADNVIYANERFRTFCKPFGEPSLDSLSRLFQADEEALGHLRTLADQAHRGLTDSIELKTMQNDSDAWFQITAQPVANWAGYVHWRVDDITRRREIDKAIRDEREKLIDFTDNAPVGFFSVDENGRFVFVNATFARWLGEDIHTILAEGTLHTYLEKVPDNAHPYDVVPGGGAKQITEVTMKGPAGKTFSASVSQAVVHEGSGIVRTRGVVHDLTAERAMRQALEASEDKFRRFYEQAPLGIAIMNSDAVLADCNPALANMLGYSIADVEGRHFEALIKDQDRAMALETLRLKNQDQKISAPMDITLLGRDREVAVLMYARRLADSRNIVLHFIDQTQQKELEAQFVQSQKMQAIGQLAGGVAHDFNNLLTAMIGFCDLLLLRHKPGDPSFSDIMQIKQNSNRAANLVRQLLAFSRQQTLRPKVQDLGDILTELSHLLRRLIGANIDLDVRHGSDIGLVKVDVGQMEQVMINLAVNARDAMPEGGKLTIMTDSFDNDAAIEMGSDMMPPGRWVTLAVSDDGTGIPPDIKSRIFEPFFTTKEVGAGTGLGLATVYGIIRQTGGYLDVDSTVGKGTTFTIYLPRLDEEAEREDSSTEMIEDETRDLTGTARIMLVEDEDAVRTFSARALANKGYEMLEADSGEAALSLFAEEQEQGKHIDLLITDVIMPNMDGPTLAKTLREDNPKMKIIFISGYTEEKLKDHMGENIWFLGKPFTLKQLAAKVKEALED